MYTVGQAKTNALQRVRQEALGIFRIVNHYCPKFLQTKDVQQFVPCWQKIIAPYYKKSLGDALKIYVLGSKLASLEKIEKSRQEKAKKYSAARFEDRPAIKISVTNWVKKYCTPKAQRGIPAFLRECWGRYPGEKITFEQFRDRWSRGQ